MFANSATPSLPLPLPLCNMAKQKLRVEIVEIISLSGVFGCRCNRCHTWSMPFPKTCFSPLQIFPKTVAIGSPSPSRSWSPRRSRGPKPAAKIDHVTNVVVGSCWWLRVFLLHRIASYRLVSFRFVFTRLVWLPLADAALLHAACCLLSGSPQTDVRLVCRGK